jgi:hypothetical protein
MAGNRVWLCVQLSGLGFLTVDVTAAAGHRGSACVRKGEGGDTVWQLQQLVIVQLHRVRPLPPLIVVFSAAAPTVHRPATWRPAT